MSIPKEVGSLIEGSIYVYAHLRDHIPLTRLIVICVANDGCKNDLHNVEDDMLHSTTGPDMTLG
jgi:hypothetical protein